MTTFTCRVPATAILVVFAMLGCGPDEVTKRVPVQPNSEGDVLSVLSVGMEMSTANEVLNNFDLIATVEDSGTAMVGSSESRRLRVGVNSNGDALYLIVSALPDGREEISDMFWHRDWVAELALPKSERNDMLADIDSVDIKDERIRKHENRQLKREADPDPFGE